MRNHKTTTNEEMAPDIQAHVTSNPSQAMDKLMDRLFDIKEKLTDAEHKGFCEDIAEEYKNVIESKSHSGI
jgi:hypothetical protein|tara:strand:+ start:4903 stop:5115 length:213 start_codon:yes stop_codon:yes gene_type:complete